ncbi:MAG: hypothetical protein GF334_10515 [Candidatus Altiarchaeales archaeon]|nr:hypothetical protein [Candidatus Altiarchaeales archaeon]
MRSLSKSLNPESEDKKVARLCLVGLGNFGRVIHSKLIKLDSCELIYCYHPSIEKAKAFDEKTGTSDLDAILNDSSLDGVVITTPNDTHLALTLKFLEAKKHVFVEKPLTSTYSDAVKLREKLLKTGYGNQILMVGHNHRRNTAIRRVKKMLGETAIGDIINVNVNKSHGGIFSFKPSNWRAQRKRHKEGPLITAGVHYIDTIHYLFGAVDSVYAVIGNISRQTEAPDSNAVLMTLENGATCFLQANYNQPSQDYFIITGTEGIIYVERGRLSLRIGRDVREENRFIPSTPSTIKTEKNDTFLEELQEFCQAILGHKNVETGLNEGLNSMAVIEACNQSNQTKKAVSMRNFNQYFK